MPIIVDAFKNDADDDLRDGEARVGEREGATPPMPWRDFIDALRCSDGVDERLSRLMELGLRWRGLRGGIFPFGDAVTLFCLPRVRAGEEGCDDEGRGFDEAALIER